MASDESPIDCDNLECLKYLASVGCTYSWTDEECLGAMDNGNHECFKFIIDNGCPLTPIICTYALIDDSVDCLKYAIDKGCPYDDDLIHEAYVLKHEKCFEYILENLIDTNILMTQDEHDIIDYAKELGYSVTVTFKKID